MENTAKNYAETPASVRMNSRGAYQALKWYLFWFLLITAIYWQGLIIFPKRDHSVFMLGRLLFDSDLEWFLKTLNYARTRLLFPGDTFAFRPVHMFIIGLEDILFRYNLVVQGLISSALFSATATALFYLLRKISGNLFLAVAATSLWAFQLAGSEILLWQHITPYVLLPGFFCVAISFLDDHYSSGKSLAIAAFLMCLAGLTHEIGGLIAVTLAFFIFFARSVSGKKYGFAFAAGGGAALSLSAFDYFFIHKIQTFTSSSDTVTISSFSSLLSSIFPFTSASGVAVLFPQGIKVFHLENWFICWDFVATPKPLMFVGTVFVTTIIMVLVFQTLVSLRRHGVTVLNIASLFALLLFGYSYAVSVFRIFTRSQEYMVSAPYYFSLLSLALSIMIVAVTVRINKPRMVFCVSVLLSLLSMMQIRRLVTELRDTRAEKQYSYDLLKNSRQLIRDNPSLCFGGMDPYTVSASHLMWHPLYQDISCANRVGATPVYLSSDVNGSSLLAKIYYYEQQTPYTGLLFSATPSHIPGLADSGARHLTAVLPFGHSFEVTLDKTKSPYILMTSQSGEQFGYALDYNLVKTIRNSRIMMVNSVLWDPGKSITTYKMSFLRNQLVLFANGLFVGTMQDVNFAADSPMKLEIFSGTNDVITMTRSLVATSASDATIEYNSQL